MTTEAPARPRSRSALAWTSIVVGVILFPLLWSAVVIGRVVEVHQLMRFLARSDAHVFYDLPGLLGDLRAYPILFTMIPAAGTALIAFGVGLLRGSGVLRALAIGALASGAVLLVAWLIAP